MHFALSVMTAYGATDVSAAYRPMRRTVPANPVIAFVFNTAPTAG
ncbi:hypothetical protein ACFZC3_08625 [Streptomyces sp. NPDC007903]